MDRPKQKLARWVTPALHLLASAALLLTTPACNLGKDSSRRGSKRAKTNRPKWPAPTLTWDTKYAVKLKLASKSSKNRKDPFAKSECKFSLLRDHKTKKAAVEVHCHRLPASLKIRFEGKDYARTQTYTSEFATYRFHHDIDKRLGGLALKALEEPNNVKLAIPLDFTFNFTGYKPLTVKPPALWVSSDLYKSWVGRSVRFASNEKPDDGKMSAVLVHKGFTGHKLVGQGTTFSDLDWIVHYTDVDTERTRSCGGYQGLGTIKLHLKDAAVTIYNRRTGEIVKEHTIKKLRASCPKSVWVSRKNANRNRISYVPMRDVARWVKTQLRRHKSS